MGWVVSVLKVAALVLPALLTEYGPEAKSQPPEIVGYAQLPDTVIGGQSFTCWRTMVKKGEKTEPEGPSLCFPKAGSPQIAPQPPISGGGEV